MTHVCLFWLYFFSYSKLLDHMLKDGEFRSEMVCTRSVASGSAVNQLYSLFQLLHPLKLSLLDRIRV